MDERFVWIFNGPRGHFPGGVFTSVKLAEAWIRANRLTGCLTRYPVNTGSYDWAVEQGLVNEKLAARAAADPDFIGSFSSASFEHRHYEAGRSEDGFGGDESGC